MGRRVALVASAALALLGGTAGAAVIKGTNRADFLRGRPSADRLDGRGGNDRIKVDGGGRDAVRCGRGRDLVNADLTDRTARDCELVARVIARDRYVSGAAQHSTIAEPDSFSWGNTVVATFQIGRFQDAAAVSIGWATSRDRGRTWRSGVLPALTTASKPAGSWGRASDPSITYDAIHRTWLITSLALGQRDAAIVVSRSSDGLRWSAPVTVTQASLSPTLLLDKEWIVCDSGPLSPFRGSCYVTYSDFRTNQLSFQASRDGGSTWEAPIGAPENAGRASMLGRWAPAPQPLVQPDGDLIVPFYDETRVASVRSTNGGRSFSNPVTIAPASFDQPRDVRSPPLPSAEIDRDGVVYIVWPDCNSRPACPVDDLVLSQSADGVTWTAPLRIPAGPRSAGRDFVLPGLGVDATRTGRLALVYYTTLPGDRLDVGFVSSTNGGRTWSAPRRLNAETMRLEWVARSGGAMVGDYMSTSFAGGTAVPVFVLASQPRARLDQPLFAAAIPVR